MLQYVLAGTVHCHSVLVQYTTWNGVQVDCTNTIYRDMIMVATFAVLARTHITNLA